MLYPFSFSLSKVMLKASSLIDKEDITVRMAGGGVPSIIFDNAIPAG